MRQSVLYAPAMTGSARSSSSISHSEAWYLKMIGLSGTWGETGLGCRRSASSAGATLASSFSHCL